MLNSTRRLKDVFKNIDYPLIALTLATAIFGIVMISSAGGSNAARYVTVQSAALVIGLIGVIVISILDYDYLARLSKYIYNMYSSADFGAHSRRRFRAKRSEKLV